MDHHDSRESLWARLLGTLALANQFRINGDLCVPSLSMIRRWTARVAHSDR